MFRKVFYPILFLVGTAVSVAADESTATPTATCLANAKSQTAREACIGESARVCEAAIKSPTPLDTVICINSETEQWQIRMTQAYDRMMEEAARLDDEHMDMISKGTPRLTDDLVLIQASWKDWTEKRCTLDSMLLRGQPRRMAVVSYCMLQQTAKQTLLLEQSADYNR